MISKAEHWRKRGRIMDRLTERNEHGAAYVAIADTLPIRDQEIEGSKKLLEAIYAIFQKLAAYEDTGLEPEEVKTNEEMFKAYRHVCGGKSPEEIKKALELLDLEEQGLLIKLPCKVGDTVYKLEDYGEWQDVPHVFIPIKCQVELIYLGDDNKVYCDLMSIDLLQDGAMFDEIPINEIYLSKEEAEKALEVNNE